jgi:class 3 adenylate cyclase
MPPLAVRCAYTPVVRPLRDRRRWLALHAGVWLLVGVITTGIWWIAERTQGMNTVYWPGLLLLLLLIPLALHAAVVFMAGPPRHAQPRQAPPPPPDPVRAAELGERALATVVFTDIVGSTERARQVGDRRWAELLDTHDRLARELVGELRGQLVKSTGDGILALFDRPGRGIRCATALRDRLRGSGVEIRAGVHTGEIQLRGDDVGGIAVHFAARVMAAAAPGEVLVSGTVHDLVAGSDHVLEDRGAHALKGIAGEWRLFAVRA